MLLRTPLISLLVSFHLVSNVWWPVAPFTPASQDQMTQADARVERAIGLLGQQDFRGAITELKAALPVFEKANAREETAQVQNLIGIAYRRMAEHEKAEQAFTSALRLSETIGDKQILAEVLNNLGILKAEMGDYQMAETHFRRALEMSEQIGLSSAARVNTLLNLALAEFQLQKPGLGRASLEKAEQVAGTVPDPTQKAALLEKIKLRLRDLPAVTSAPVFEAWEVSGFGITACPCDTPCPCRSMAAPTTGSCQEASFVHFAKGRYGAVDLAGISFIMLQVASENQADRWGSLYITNKASEAQVDALQNIFRDISSNKQAHFGRVVKGELTHRIEPGKIYTIEMPGVLRIKAKMLTDRRGRPAMETAAFDPFSNVIQYMKNIEYRFSDQAAGKEWDYSGKQANYRSFTTSQEMYKRGEMLAQYPETNGFFNARQLQLIKKQRLPMLKEYPKGKPHACCSASCANPLINK